MVKMVGLIKNKVEEYGIPILKHHDGEENQYVFFCQDMVIFVHPDNKSVSVAFQATTKPDVAAMNTLILSEIKNIDIDIMESFICCKDNKLVSGDEAYALIRDTIKAEGASDYMREEAFTHLLNSVPCHEC